MTQLPPHLERLSDLDAAWAEASAGVRLEAVRRGARKLRETLTRRGKAVCVRTADLVTFPYPSEYALQGVARSPAPYVMMRNRVQLVQVEAGGGLVNILVNPSDYEKSKAAPFFARMVEKYGELGSNLLASRHGTVETALAAWGLRGENIDYLTFDHLHVQDLRGLMQRMPRARLLVQSAELRILRCLHPLQRDWYVADGIAGIADDRFVELDGDYAIGAGFALVRTPGHTEGNHSPAVVTDRGVWTISENGVCVDAYSPESSRIRGLRGHARRTGCEVVLNANTRERSLDQYTSMVLEKTLADATPDRPEFAQHFPSSEMVRSLLAPGLAPTFSHGAITHGDVRARPRVAA